MKLTSNFQNGSEIDKRYTGEGQDISPPLSWSDGPTDTKTFVLICDDPDAPSPRKPAKDPWVHWIIYNIPAEVTQLPEGMPRDPVLNQFGGARQGLNSWPSDRIGYRGPMPPEGSGAHRYFFKLYAIDTRLDIAAERATQKLVLAEIEGHILAECHLFGTYER
jgi:Raf kinase inhibitor-like YbhB/YbcL family protein